MAVIDEPDHDEQRPLSEVDRDRDDPLQHVGVAVEYVDGNGDDRRMVFDSLAHAQHIAGFQEHHGGAPTIFLLLDSDDGGASV